MTSPAAQPNGTPVASVASAEVPDQPQTALDLASDQVRMQGAMALSDRIKDRRYLEALTNAEAKMVYGELFQPKTDDPMVAIDSKFETHHHHPPPPAQPQAKPKPAWLAPALIVAALAGTAGAGAWLGQALKPSGGAATTPLQEEPSPENPDKSKSYSLEFWEP